MAAWCFREAQAAEAFRLLRGSDLYAPRLLAYELTSVARRKVLERPELRAVLEGALEIALALPIHWSDVDHLTVLDLALNTGLTTYDATYLYLARGLGMPLATFDRDLSRAASVEP